MDYVWLTMDNVWNAKIMYYTNINAHDVYLGISLHAGKDVRKINFVKMMKGQKFHQRNIIFIYSNLLTHLMHGFQNK
jgi:hypothetical protein